LGVQCTKKGRSLVCSMSGELDLVGAAEFRAEVQGWFRRYESLKNIILDLTAVEFVDSSGLGAILGRYKQVSGMGGKLLVIGLRPNVRRVFEFSGVLKLVQEAESEARALAVV